MSRWRLSIDGHTIIVGAPREASNGTAAASNAVDSAGAAYVFVRDGSVSAEEALLKASNVGPGDRFGVAVSIDGTRVVVGADGEDGDGTSPDDDSAPFSGAAYVFSRESGSWAVEAYLKAGNPDEYDRFGGQVALDEDTAVVAAVIEDGDGSSPEDGGADGAGAVYVFERRQGRGATGRSTCSTALMARGNVVPASLRHPPG